MEATESTALTPSIPVDPIEEKASTKKLVRRQIIRGLRRGLALGGIVFSAVSFIISPSTLLAVYLIVHILLYLLFLRLAVPPKPSAWGIVYDAKTGKPLRFAVARIFETQYNKLLATQVTDVSGRYSFLVGKNAYYTTYEKTGYEFKKSNVHDLRGAKEPEIVAPNIGLTKKE